MNLYYKKICLIRVVWLEDPLKRGTYQNKLFNLEILPFPQIIKNERLKRSNLIIVPISVCLLDSSITFDAGSSEIVTESNYILDFAACKFLPS